MKRVVARAFANIALIKYWGKKPGANNIPATPSISLTLEALRTETIIEKIESRIDRFYLNSETADKQTASRLRAYLDYWRRNGLIEGHFSISSENHFPTGTGLASSSSGFAALAVGLGAFAGKKLSRQELSRLARLGSGSAARSVIGGLAALPVRNNPAARLIMEHARIPWGMVVVLVEASRKVIGSREGMELCQKYSPYYNSWLKQAGGDYRQALRAARKLNLTAIGEITEANALAMHACMMACRPPLLYLGPATIAIIKAVQDWRKSGIKAYATVDAGAQVMLLCKKEDLQRVARSAKAIPGVKAVIKSRPAGGASIIEWN
jgi:diphosphomevalonate decarboxylase